MKIIHSSNVFASCYGGGIQEVVANLVKSQRADASDVSLIYPAVLEGVRSDSPDVASVEFPNLLRSPAKFLWALYSLLSAYERGSFIVVHQHGVFTRMSVVASALCAKLELPLVVQPHGLLEPIRLRKGFIKKQLALWTYEHVHLRLANALIACSRAEAVSLQKKFPAKEIFVIPNGVSDDFFTEIPERSPTPEKKKLLFFSQLIPVKGIERLLEAVAAVGPNFTKHWNLELAGYGEEKYLTKLRTLVNKLDLDSIVTFSGPAYGADRIKLIDSCDAFILPTYNENFGIVIAEAMARGKLVITTKGAPWPDIADFDTGFWVDNTVEGLKSSLMALSSLTLDELMEKGVNGRRVCEQKYRWKAIRKPYHDLYQYLLGEAERPNFLHS